MAALAPQLAPTSMASGRNRVSYESDGDTVAAHLFLPPDFDADRQYPAILFVRPATGVKEQTAGLYAEKMAARGFVTLAFDPRGFGESMGRRLLENPFRVIEDARNSITYLQGLPFVSRTNTFSAGVCMGGGYASYAAASDDRIKAVASITPYLTFHLDYPALYGGRAITRVLAGFFDVVVRAFAALGIQLYWYAVPSTPFAASLPFTLEITRGMRAYYLNGRPGDRPTWRNRINMASQVSLIAYDSFTVTPVLRKPFYMAYGTRGYSPHLLQQFFDDVQTPRADKHLRVLEAQHFEMYWQPHLVDPIVDDLDRFFRKYIDADEPGARR